MRPSLPYTLFSKYARTADAVFSGRKVKLEPPSSPVVKVYISFCTTSVVSPIPRKNNLVSSKAGVRISLNPYTLQILRIRCSILCQCIICSGKKSCVPLGFLIAITQPPKIFHKFYVVSLKVHLSFRDKHLRLLAYAV